jgi:hypothetical protein
MSYVLNGATCALAITFGLASAGKLRARHEFVASLRQLGVPAGLRSWLAWLLPAAELLTAGMLLTPATRAVGAMVALALLSVFTVVAIRSARSGGRVRCTCFGSHGGTLGIGHALRNGLLGALALTEILAEHPSQPTQIGPSAVACAAGVLVGVAFSRWDELIFLFRTDLPLHG